MTKNIRLLISGGPGSGCTSTAAEIGNALELPVLDSDAYFHVPSDPPFQKQYSPEERRRLLAPALAARPSWILGGSVATWELPDPQATHGVFLNVPTASRLARLEVRQRNQFGTRIDAGGDLREEHESFLRWAAGYAERTTGGRNLQTDRAYLAGRCGSFLEITGTPPMDQVVSRILEFLGAE